LTKIEKLLKKWRNHIPPEVSKEEVWKVVEEFFPESERATGTGSHEFKISSSIIERFIEKNLSEYEWQDIQHIVAPFDRWGKIVIPCKKGRIVKGRYIKILLRAISKQKEIEKLMEGEER